MRRPGAAALALAALCACRRAPPPAAPGSAAGDAVQAPPVDSAAADLLMPRLAVCVPAKDGAALVLRELGPASDSGQPLLRQRVDSLLADPASPFPPGTRLLALYDLGGGAWVADLSSEVRKLQGADGERIAIGALVQTLAIDTPALKSVRLLIDGQPGETLGHLDLADPFEPVKGWCAEEK